MASHRFPATLSAVDCTEVQVKSALVRSGIPGVDVVINPYTGCSHGCRYCYAVFMTKFARTHQGALWGSFVEAKTNVVEVLRSELARKRKKGTAFLSSVCDPYQPAELRYELTRGCLQALREFGWGIEILTRSPMVLRDRDILRGHAPVSVGFSIGTDDDRVRRALEPRAPPIGARIAALRKLHEAGIPTWVFIAPVLPMNPRQLANQVEPLVDSVLLSALNYRSRVAGLFRQNGWGFALTQDYAKKTKAELKRLLGHKM